MRYNGEATRPVAQSGGPLDGPTFAYGDPLSEQLLFARAAWGLHAAPEIPAPSPRVEVGKSPVSDAEQARLAAVWLRGWDNLWAVYDLANSAAASKLVISESSQAELFDWRSAAGSVSPAAGEFAEWSGLVPRHETLGSRYANIAIVAHVAFQRGLRCVYVLPVVDEWWTVPGDHIMLVSRSVHDSTDLLVRALQTF